MGNRRRPESQFDAEAVFGACIEHGVAVEINCRPERQDPPDNLLRLAAEMGCMFAIDTDAHAPGQLDWLGQRLRSGRGHGHRPRPGHQHPVSGGPRGARWLTFG